MRVVGLAGMARWREWYIFIHHRGAEGTEIFFTTGRVGRVGRVDTARRH